MGGQCGAGRGGPPADGGWKRLNPGAWPSSETPGHGACAERTEGAPGSVYPDGNQIRMPTELKSDVSPDCREVTLRDRSDEVAARPPHLGRFVSTRPTSRLRFRIPDERGERSIRFKAHQNVHVVRQDRLGENVDFLPFGCPSDCIRHNSRGSLVDDPLALPGMPCDVRKQTGRPVSCHSEPFRGSLTPRPCRGVSESGPLTLG